jgi:WD40 repeat protein
VLIVDQAEEALLADDGSCLIPFGDQLLTAAADETRVVLVLRADFFGLLAGHAVLARRAGPATVLVGAPGERALRRIITEPAARVGLRVDPELADLIVSEVRDRPGVLPVLSTALVRTWEQREGDLLSVASYRAGGGVEAALQRVGEEAWAALDDDAQRSACRRLLIRLATDEDGSWVRRWARRAELVRGDDPAAVAALAVLTARRLVVARADDLGIAHEALLSGWPRLRDWLEDGRSRAAVRERLAIAAAAWEQADRDSGELYQGTRLQAALDTAAASPEDLTSLERAFLVESANEADRQLTEQRARADREARGRRRARLVAAGLAVALAFAASAGTYAITKQRQAQRASTAADASRLGALARAGGDYNRSLLLAAQAVTLHRSPATESDLFATLLRGDAVLAALQVPSRGGGDVVQAAAMSPDGRSLFAVNAAGSLLQWPTRGGSAKELHLGADATHVAVVGDGRVVAGRYFDNGDSTLRLLDPGDGRVLADVPDDENVSWALSQDRRDVVFAPPSGGDSPASSVLVWRLGTPVATIRRVPVGAPVVQIVSCGATTACVLTKDRHLVRVRRSDAKVEGRVALPSDMLDSVAASADGHFVAIARPDGILRLVDPRTGRVLKELGGASRDVRPLAFSPDGRKVVAGDFDTLLVWRLDRPGLPGLPERYDVFGGRVLFAAFSPDGSTLASGGYGATVVLLDATGRRHVGAVLTDALGDDTATLWTTQQAIVVGQFRGRLLFVDPSDGAIHPAEGHSGTEFIVSARAGRAGTPLVTADQAGLTAVWDVKTHQLLGTVDLPPPRDPFSPDVWVAPDGRHAATIRNPAGPIVIDLVTRKVLRQLPALPPPATEFTTAVQGWTADGRSILISRQFSTTEADLLVVDATTGAIKLRVPTGVFLGEVTADPSGKYLALAMGDGTLRILDAKDGHALAPPLRANDGEVFNVSVSPDGRYISVSGYPPRVTVWDTRTFRQVATPLPLDVDARDARARFAPDGRLIVTSGNVLRAFTIDPATWLARACHEAGRTLTPAEFEEVLPGRPYKPACA